MQRLRALWSHTPAKHTDQKPVTAPTKGTDTARKCLPVETHSDRGVASGRPSPQIATSRKKKKKKEGQSSIWEFFLWAFPSSLLPPPQEAGECLSRLPRQFVLVISKHWALPHSLHSSNGQKPRPGLDQSPGLSAPGVGQASWEQDQTNMGQRDKDKTTQ